MKHLSSYYLMVAMVVMFIPVACAQDPSPGQAEYDFLATLVGKHTYKEQSDGGSCVFQ